MRSSTFYGFLYTSLVLLTAVKASAQSITPEANSHTQVLQSGDTFTITGGVISADEQNLFHTFEAFGLAADQIANFRAQPETEAIIGRIVGGDASYVDGLLQVSGGSADLYLINPAGILLGPNTQLDLSGSFTVATASGIQFGEVRFNAVGTNEYSQLTGSPTGFVFENATSGAIANAADLTVSTGESILLIGGQVISTGTLTAPEGNVTIAAIPEASLVRISHPEMLLNLELATLPQTTKPLTAFTPLSLPELLTGGAIDIATELTVGPTGTITLLASGTEVAPVAGSAIATGTLNVAGMTGGEVAVVGDRVNLLGTVINASGAEGGGLVRLGGDYPGQLTLPRSQLTYVDEATTLVADADFAGEGGHVIVWSDGITAFYGNVSARGGSVDGNGGFVEVSGAQSLVFQGSVDTSASVGTAGELLLDPTDIVIRNGTIDGNDSDALVALLSEPVITSDAIGPTEIYESELEGLSGDTDITLQASNTITIENLTDDVLTFQTGQSSIRFEAGGTFTMDPGDRIVAPGHDVTIAANGDVMAGDIETFGDGNFVLPDNADGDITITGASITAGVLNALEPTPIEGLGGGNSSQVYLESTEGDITVDSILGGDGGVGINAAGWFRAVETFVMLAGPEGATFTPNITSVVAADPEGDIVIQRGDRMNLETLQGVTIAYDVTNSLPPIPLEFTLGPITGPAITIASDEGGTAGAILRTRPDRTIVTAFENQAFLLDTTLPVDTTILDSLSDEVQPESNAASSEAETALTVCNEDEDDEELRLEERDDGCEEEGGRGGENRE